ncbi:BMP family protein [Rhizobium puerariae]|uniref:BMP family protein n=1 Tax=Rhizobium puerariae TaxID=1585791 RepID=A0ABV6AJA6_9HYPH
MKNRRSVIITTFGAALAAFALATSGAGHPAFAEEQSIAGVLSGPLGDLSFMDSANAGFKKITSGLNIPVRVLEGNTSDAPGWERNLTQISSTGQYGLIIAGSTQISSTLKKVSAQFPDQKYVIFDNATVGPNVTGIAFAQNEGAFLAGALAALVTDHPDLFPRAKGSKKVGVIGGKDIPVIRDFIIGFEQGAKAVDPSIAVDIRFTDDFGNAQKGFDVATAMFNDGVDVIYQVAGGSGIGILKAGQTSGRYTIGTDTDQSPLQPESVVGSALKDVGAAVFNAAEAFSKGELKPGTTLISDLKSKGVDFVVNPKLTPDSITGELDTYRQKVVSGEIKVNSAFNK